MKMIYVDCGLRNKYEIDIHSNENYLSGSEKKKRPEKKFRPVRGLYRDFNPGPLRCRCSALPTEITSQLGNVLYVVFITAKIAFIFSIHIIGHKVL